LVAEIEAQNVMIKLNFQEKKIGLREENNLAILIKVEEDLQTIEEMEIEINLEIRKNHTMEIEILEEDPLETEVVVVEAIVTNLLEEEAVAEVDTVTTLLEEEAVAVVDTVTTLLEEEVVAVVDTVTTLLEEEVVAVVDMVTTLLEEEVVAVVDTVTNPRGIMVEVEVMETAMVETITEAETLVTNLIQAKNSTTERRIQVKNENLRIRATETTNVKLISFNYDM